MSGSKAQVSRLISEAIEFYADDPAVRETLELSQRRLHEPLRVAIVGMVKAGKSTLLNALIGEEIAPTDAGECTKVVTWYRYGDTPRVTLHPIDGEPTPLPVKRVQGRLVPDLGSVRADEVLRLVVDWPAKSLRTMTLIDTPGIASLSTDVSARSLELLLPQGSLSEVDAVVYLLRHLHAEDLTFLQAFRGRAGADLVNSVAVLSRADEVGAGRIDSLISAGKIAQRYRSDPALLGLVLDVLPVAGLLAQSARTLRQSEYATLAEVARLGRSERERLLVSAERFAQPTEAVASTPKSRSAIIERFGLFGLRMAAAVINGGAARATALSQDLARRSGLDQLRSTIADQFEARSSYLTGQVALSALGSILRQNPRAGDEQLATSLERIQASAHDGRELTLLASLRGDRTAFPVDIGSALDRLIGGQGVRPATRLGLAANAPVPQLRDAARLQLEQWRERLGNPLADRAEVLAYRVAVRTCEGILSELDASVGLVPSWFGLAVEPGPGAGQEGDDQRKAG